MMGELNITRLDTGEKTTFQIDGTVIKEQSEISINWCDKCEKWKPLEFGRYDGAQGLNQSGLENTVPFVGEVQIRQNSYCTLLEEFHLHRRIILA
jgi:hypothetical protein